MKATNPQLFFDTLISASQINPVLRGPQEHPVWWFSGDHRTQHEVIFISMTYYSKRTQSRISKGKGTWDEAESENQALSLPRAISQWRHTGHSYLPRLQLWQQVWNAVYQWSSETQCLLYWGWSCRHPLPSINQNSRSLETMHVFSVNHNVYINISGTVSHSYQEWWDPSCQWRIPDVNQGPHATITLAKMRRALKGKNNTSARKRKRAG